MESTQSNRNNSAAVEALIKLGELNLGYVPWTASAMTPQAIVYILNEIIINQRRCIMELGMGLSTLFIAKLMQEIHDLQLISIDHDSAWIEICRHQLTSKSLDTDRHQVIYAPLTRQKSSQGDDFEYYDIQAFSLDQTFKPDLVIVDGPPAWREDISEARVPAYDALLPIIHSNATVFVDDYQRPGETKLVNLFLADSCWTLAHQDPEANITILRNGEANYNIF